MKRKSTDFTNRFTIEIFQGLRGQFWSQLLTDKSRSDDCYEWEQPGVCATRAEALSAAEYELDRMTEKWLEEGETE